MQRTQKARKPRRASFPRTRRPNLRDAYPIPEFPIVTLRHWHIGTLARALSLAEARHRKAHQYDEARTLTRIMRSLPARSPYTVQFHPHEWKLMIKALRHEAAPQPEGHNLYVLMRTRGYRAYPIPSERTLRREQRDRSNAGYRRAAPPNPPAQPVPESDTATLAEIMDDLGWVDTL